MVAVFKHEHYLLMLFQCSQLDFSSSDLNVAQDDTMFFKIISVSLFDYV